MRGNEVLKGLVEKKLFSRSGEGESQTTDFYIYSATLLLYITDIKQRHLSLNMHGQRITETSYDLNLKCSTEKDIKGNRGHNFLYNPALFDHNPANQPTITSSSCQRNSTTPNGVIV
jgi:hypothetical protein